MNPDVSIVDGILAMEGQGPGMSGTPRRLSAIVGGSDPFCVDAAICRMVGLSPEKSPTLRAARQIGISIPAPSIRGDFDFVRDFKLPQLFRMIDLPEIFHGVMRKHLTQRPAIREKICVRCGECAKICQAKAISLANKGFAFDYDKCIRCYCCLEICPAGAVRTEETLPGKMLRSIAEAVSSRSSFRS